MGLADSARAAMWTRIVRLPRPSRPSVRDVGGHLPRVFDRGLGAVRRAVAAVWPTIMSITP